MEFICPGNSTDTPCLGWVTGTLCVQDTLQDPFHLAVPLLDTRDLGHGHCSPGQCSLVPQWPWAPEATGEDPGVTSSPCSRLNSWCWNDFGRSSLHCVWSKLERWARRELGQRLAGGKRITDKFIPLINKDINDDAIKKKQDSLEKTVERPSKEERCLDNSFTLYCLVKNVLF